MHYLLYKTFLQFLSDPTTTNLFFGKYPTKIDLSTKILKVIPFIFYYNCPQSLNSAFMLYNNSISIIQNT